jgi:membrane-bound serine protease (ClpP class)
METVVTLILVGAALLLLETVLPGMIAGILGILCLVAGVVMGYATFGMRTGNLILFAVGLGLIIGTLYWIKYFPNSSMAKVFVSRQTVGDLGVEKPELLNQTGVAHTNLRPSGTAVINGQRIDVVTEGAMIERGTPIKVVAIEGMRVVVRAA